MSETATATRPQWVSGLPRGACTEAVKWGSQFPTAQKAWDACGRGDWMLWHAEHFIGERGSKLHKKLVLCTCECSRLALKHIPRGEDRPRIAIETAEAWARGEHDDLARVKAAAAAASSYAAAAAASSYAAATAADAYATYAARSETLAACANIVRKHYARMPR